METKRIEIIGEGNVGSALARGLKRAGHEVRAVGKDKMAIQGAASWAEIVLLAVPCGQASWEGGVQGQLGDSSRRAL